MSVFKKNVIITFGTDVLNLGVGLLSGIITARCLGPEGKGIFAFVTLIPAMIVMFGNFGVGQSVVYFIGQKRFDRNEVFNSLIVWLLFSCTALVGICVMITYLVPEFKYREYLLILIPTIYFQIGSRFFSSILLGQQQLKEYNYARFIKSSSLVTLYICFLLFMKWGIIGAFVAYVLSDVFQFVFVVIKSRPREYSFKFRINWHWLKESLNYGKKIYLSNLVNFINYKADRFLIVAFLNPYQLGLYVVASNLAEKIWMIPNAISIVLFPKVSSQCEEDASNTTRLVSSATLGISLFLGLLMILTGYWIITTLFGIDFKNAYLPFAVLITGIIPFTLFKVVSAYFTGIGKQSYVLRITIIIAIVNVMANLWLLPRYGIIGASLASSISYSLGGIVSVYWASKISSYPMHSFLSFWKVKYLEKTIMQGKVV